jgi:hypothetical protein
MARERTPRFPTGNLARKSEPHHHGRSPLAEVVPMRAEAEHRQDSIGALMTRIAQVFASLRLQAAPVDSPPLPPSSPALHTHLPWPDDAA